MTVISFFYNKAKKQISPFVNVTKGLCYRKKQLKVFGKGRAYSYRSKDKGKSNRIGSKPIFT
jgi:hypothetical protein